MGGESGQRNGRPKRELDPEGILDLIYLPVTAKLVTLGELKKDYTLNDYFKLMESTEDVIKRLCNTV